LGPKTEGALMSYHSLRVKGSVTFFFPPFLVETFVVFFVFLASTYSCVTMAVGKTKKTTKVSTKKGGKKKVTDPFTRKEWYDIKAPSVFGPKQQVGKTFVNRTTGTKIASDNLKHRVFEVNLADLTNDEDKAYRKIRLRAEDTIGKNVLTNFWGMDLTTDKYRSLVRKWQSLIEATVDVKTTDNYYLRIFAIAFTARRQNQIRKTSYAQSSQKRAIRKKMVDIITRESNTVSLNDLVAKFIPESISNQIVKECQMIYPLTNVFIKRVKVIKTPKFDTYKLQELFGEIREEKGQAVAIAPVAAAPEAAAPAAAETTA